MERALYEVHERMVGEKREEEEEDGKWKKEQREGRYVVERERSEDTSLEILCKRKRERGKC